MANKVIHKRSTVKGQLPTGSTLEHGEIAVNFNSQDPFLSIKDSDGTYRKIIDETAINDKLSKKSDTGHTHDDVYVGKQEFEDNELVVAQALNNLNEAISGIEGNILYLSADKPSNFDEILSILQDICDNQNLHHLYIWDIHQNPNLYLGEAEVVRYYDGEYRIINNVMYSNSYSVYNYIFKTDGTYKRTEDIVDKLDKMINVTYSQLKELRDNSQLVPGQQYRITDYVTTTTQENTQSAGNQFDVIVTADDEKTLNETARAIQHDGDTYFLDSNVNAWQIWYCLDNDTERFNWADATNGKGVIYRMIDEFNNDCPYDFKNIQFKHPKDTTTYPDYYYTFSTVIDGVVTDHSLLQGYCYDNTMKEYISSEKQTLNKNVFLNTSKTGNCYSNSFGENCDFNSFGDSCYSNSFGDNCYYNSFGENCVFNSFGDNCYYNSFGNNCHSNSFGNDCDYNSFGNNCYRNSFGDNYDDNSFGNYCSSNSFGNGCDSNSFGNYCGNNSFGNYCGNNSFGNYCFFNSFGNNCTDNSFGNGCTYNSFGNSCDSNSFGNSCTYNSFRVDGSKTASLKNYVRYNHFDDGCSFNVIWNSGTTSGSVWLKNININRGVCGTFSSYNIINIDVLNQDYEIQVYKEESGYTMIDTFPAAITISDIDLIWAQYFGDGGYGSGSASAIGVDDIINSIGVGDYDETEQ